MDNGAHGARKLSLSRELLLVAAKIEALRESAARAVRLVRRDDWEDAALVIGGGLLMLRQRVLLVERVVMGEADAAVVLCKANEADWSEEGPGVVAQWSPEELVERLQADRRGKRARDEWEFLKHLSAVCIVREKPGGKP